MRLVVAGVGLEGARHGGLFDGRGPQGSWQAALAFERVLGEAREASGVAREQLCDVKLDADPGVALQLGQGPAALIQQVQGHILVQLGPHQDMVAARVRGQGANPAQGSQGLGIHASDHPPALAEGAGLKARTVQGRAQPLP